MSRRSSKAICALLVTAVWAASSLACAAQAVSAGSRAPGPSRIDLYGGYAYFHPFNSDIYYVQYQPIDVGAVTSVTGYFNPHFGVQVEGQFSPHGPDDCVYTAQAGPVYRLQLGRFVPFAHLLAGGARVGGPLIQPCTWGYGATVGFGTDYILPYQRLHNRVAIRPIQGDFTYSYVDFGARTAPTFDNGSVGKITAWRLSAGVVLRLGEMLPEHPAAYGCEASPVTVFPGDPVTVTGRVINLEAGRKLHPVYTWATTGGRISGSTETATINTTGLASGDYTIAGRVTEGPRPTEHAECNASFRVRAYEPPTLACSANPSTIMPGGLSTITVEGRSPQNRQLAFSYSASAGQISGQPAGTAATATLTAIDVSPGVITVTCNTVDDLGQSATATTSVTVVAPPPPPAPSARALCSVAFERDRKRPVRVDNEAKGCLDDIALELNREANAILIVVGKHDPEEKPEAAAERTLNIKLYLTQEKGIDPTRIELRTGESTGRSADNVLVPPGAQWDPSGTTSFDPARVQRHGEPYAPPRP